MTSFPSRPPSTSGARRCPLSAPRELDLGLPASSKPWGHKPRRAGRRGPRTSILSGTTALLSQFLFLSLCSGRRVIHTRSPNGACPAFSVCAPLPGTRPPGLLARPPSRSPAPSIRTMMSSAAAATAGTQTPTALADAAAQLPTPSLELLGLTPPTSSWTPRRHRRRRCPLVQSAAGRGGV